MGDGVGEGVPNISNLHFFTPAPTFSSVVAQLLPFTTFPFLINRHWQCETLRNAKTTIQDLSSTTIKRTPNIATQTIVLLVRKSAQINGRGKGNRTV